MMADPGGRTSDSKNEPRPRTAALAKGNAAALACRSRWTSSGVDRLRMAKVRTKQLGCVVCHAHWSEPSAAVAAAETYSWLIPRMARTPAAEANAQARAGMAAEAGRPGPTTVRSAPAMIDAHSITRERREDDRAPMSVIVWPGWPTRGNLRKRIRRDRELPIISV